MDDFRDPEDDTVTPEAVEAGPAPAPRRRRRRGLLVALGTVATLVIVGVPSALALYLNLARGAGDVVDRMVPNDADVYATVYLDPSLSQKMNLQGLIGHFPALKSADQLQGKIDQGMDVALQPEGLSFAKDVRPWLGTQVALAMRLTDGTPTAVIIASRDDTRAAATLARVRTTDTGSGDHWSEQQHGGISVWVGTPPAGTDLPSIAYAYLDHTAVIGNSAAMIDSVIDTDQGRRPALRTTAAYTSTLQRLPAERVALAYASGPGITGALRKALSDTGLGDPSVLKLFDQGAGSLRSLGLAVSAQHNGLEADLAEVTDTSKLTPAERAALQPSATNATLDWIPADAAGFVAFGGLKEGIRSLIQGMPSGAGSTGLDLTAPLHALGLSDPKGVLSHLTGDVALEVRTGSGSAFPGGALLAATDDAAAVRSFLDGLVAGFGALAPLHTESYRGATITSIPIPGLGDAGVAPAYTVADGMVVIGSSPAEVRAVLDAHATGSRITATPGFTAAGGGFSPAEPVLYLDLDRVRAAVEKLLPADLTHDYDTQVKPNVAPLHALRFTEQSSAGQVTEQVFLAAG
ncbi:MAG: DUF3352 domain-containing protein [Chloroflexi bacterium]|nr:MAG: DUF3352 domain-containing protein [Chloroflexota bacterium]